MHDYKASPEGLPAPLKEEQDLLLMSGGWLGPRFTQYQWARAQAPPTYSCSGHILDKSSGQRAQSCHTVGLKGCIHQKRAPLRSRGPAWWWWDQPGVLTGKEEVPGHGGLFPTYVVFLCSEF